MGSAIRLPRGGAAVGPRSGGGRSGFTFVEVLIVVVILAILAAIAVPQFTNARDETTDTSLRRQLQVIRHQIEYYRAEEKQDPDLIGNQWDDLVLNDYLHWEPVNPINKSTLIADAPAADVGWVWQDAGNGTNQLYGVDADGGIFQE